MILLENRGVLPPTTDTFRAFAKCSCPGKDEHLYHEPCAGKYTKRTKSYTWPFTDVIHKAWRNSQLAIHRGIESCEAR